MPHYLLDPYVWLSIAALIAVFEFLFVPGVGFLMLAGSAAAMAPLVSFGIVTTKEEMWLALGAVFVVLMYFFIRPLRRSYGKGGAVQSNCRVGEKAEVVVGPITKSFAGRVKYSKGQIPAVLVATDSVEEVNEGDIVEVVAVHGQMAEISIGYK